MRILNIHTCHSPTNLFIESTILTYKKVKRFGNVADVNIIDTFQFHGRATVCSTAQDVRHYICFLNKGILL